MIEKLTLWDYFLRLFGIKTTWRWCIVGCTIGRHEWSVSREKCRNGTPILSGWFLEVIAFEDEGAARRMCEEFQKVAKEYNEKNGYAP